MTSASPIQAPSRVSLGPIMRELDLGALDLLAEEQVLPAEEQVLHVIEGSPIPFTIELEPESEPNEGLGAAEASAVGQQSDPAVGQQSDPAVGQQFDPAVGQQCDPAVGQQSDPAVGQQSDPAMGQQSDPAVGQQSDPAVALAYFRRFYAKDGKMVSFSFPVARVLRKEDPLYAKHWDILMAQRSCERPGAAEGDLINAVGKKIQSHVRNFLGKTEPGKKRKKVKVQLPPAQKGLRKESGSIPEELMTWFRYFAILFQLFYEFTSFAISIQGGTAKMSTP